MARAELLDKLQTDVENDMVIWCDSPLVTNSVLFQLLTADCPLVVTNSLLFQLLTAGCPLVVTNSLLFQLLTADPKSAGERKEMLPEEKAKSTNLMTLWDFEGVLKYSPIFYGYYTNRDGTRNGYRLPFAYFMTGLAVYIYSFVATLKRYGLH